MSYFNEIRVVENGKIDSNNTTTTPLDAGATFTGVLTDTLDYAEAIIAMYSDQDSASKGLEIQSSSDGTTWRTEDEYTYDAGSEKTYSVQFSRKYFRIVYTNGGTDQTVMDLSVIFHKFRSKPSSHPIGDMIINDDDAELTKAVITAEDENGDFVNVRAIQGQTGNNLKVSVDQVDPSTNSLKTIDYSHAELHAGDHYVCSDPNELDSAATQVFLLTTPNTTKWIHMSTIFDGTAITQIDIYEGADRTGTTALTCLNRNRNSIKTAGLTIHRGVSGGTTDGTLLPLSYKSGSATNQARSAATNRSENELILKQNTKYLIRITSGSADNLTNVIFDWYEHTNLV